MFLEFYFFDRKNSLETDWGHFRSPAADAARAASAAKAAPLGDQDNLPFKLGFTVTTFAFASVCVLSFGEMVWIPICNQWSTGVVDGVLFQEASMKRIFFYPR